jgi:predicted  nucleic acid-binding Zn-ribbon protein
MLVTSVLRECHRLRVHLRNLKAEIDAGPRVLAEHQEELDAARAAHAAHYDAITRLKLKQRDDEGTLKQTDDRLKKLRDQLEALVAPKERAAKELEIVHAEEKKAGLEDAILATITELEEKQAAVPEVEAKWKAAQDEFAQFQTEAAERLERMTADTAESQAALDAAELQLTSEVKGPYATIVKAKGPEAFAGAKARVCQGCRTSMTEMQFITLREGTFRTCVTCGRMQYPVE